MRLKTGRFLCHTNFLSSFFDWKLVNHSKFKGEAGRQVLSSTPDCRSDKDIVGAQSRTLKAYKHELLTNTVEVNEGVVARHCRIIHRNRDAGRRAACAEIKGHVLELL